MRTDSSRSDWALESAVAVAIAGTQLPPAAHEWRKTVLLEELAGILGLPRNTLRNLYYREDERFEAILLSFVASNQEQLLDGLRELRCHGFSPVVWRRPEADLRASFEAMRTAVPLAAAAERPLRESEAPPLPLRRELGAVAAEIMACALTFLVGEPRRRQLLQGERIFLAAMGPLAFECDVAEADAVLFARFWENRASRCGMEWSNIWDDPDLPPPVDMDVVRLAVGELAQAADWIWRHGAGPRTVDDGERLRQLLADKAKWLAKSGEFAAARRELDRLSDFDGPAALADALLVRTLERIAENQLVEAARSAGALAELRADAGDDDGVAPVTAAIMVHNIELLRGRRSPVPERVQHFLRSSPVAACETVDLTRYRRRLATLGLGRPQAVGPLAAPD